MSQNRGGQIEGSLTIPPDQPVRVKRWPAGGAETVRCHQFDRWQRFGVAEVKKPLRRIGNAALKRFGAVFEEDEVKP
ncbi:MAG: hypothetical protein QF586_06305 [Arenicellales bacterium]|nr:hypothetical protein [Arenicellales bacterium]MDP6289816.1 hypothetical protein [Arenicellales bacterium]MDP7283406.1 hypothetical protein [Arenicellales bacterium]